MKQLTERCKEGPIVDQDDLSLILSLNIEDYGAPETYNHHGLNYGQAIQELGRAVVTQAGELIVPNSDDYSRTHVLKAPSNWVRVWSSDETIPSLHTLWAQFDMYSALTPDGRLLVIDGPGAHSLENWERYSNERNRVLEMRRLRRLAGGR
ncbi:hypothetical protein [Mesorhizobium sp. YM1C-6-2]|uniref:hypothetical protein n=1 Tax=Mesorhizobium sp. YM1C-6-2 TaxID=1827501 RepID=UPI0011C49F14|nr:hypothetical protein [Mesorhizobium sp. YM1C-6-2]